MFGYKCYSSTNARPCNTGSILMFRSNTDRPEGGCANPYCIELWLKFQNKFNSICMFKCKWYLNHFLVENICKLDFSGWFIGLSLFFPDPSPLDEGTHNDKPIDKPIKSFPQLYLLPSAWQTTSILIYQLSLN